MTPETPVSELRSLEEAKEHNPKYLTTLDDDPPVSHKGIKRIKVKDFLFGVGRKYIKMEEYLCIS